MSTQVNTESFEQLITLLGQYIENMSACAEALNQAAGQCNDNLGSEEIGRIVIDKVQNCHVKITNSINDASGLKNAATAKLHAIEAALNKFAGGR